MVEYLDGSILYNDENDELEVKLKIVPYDEVNYCFNDKEFDAFILELKRIMADKANGKVELVCKKSNNAIGLYAYGIRKFYYFDLDKMKFTIKKPKNYYRYNEN